ncbi:hypothetical protein ACN077_20675 [Clostridium chromiireducens]|uniref:hypothetical protein n=1 Tax=Clostridium chromiireducens TaxID=225345 RepID=UPI003AF6D39F
MEFSTNIKSKIYYNLTGIVIAVTPEQEKGVITTIETDLDHIPDLDIKTISCIELPYGTMAETFNNAKSYSVNVETKELIIEHGETTPVIDDELTERIFNLSEYLSQQSAETVTDIENYILQNEINKIMEGIS